jgi:hypothetical protein
VWRRATPRSGGRGSGQRAGLLRGVVEEAVGGGGGDGDGAGVDAALSRKKTRTVRRCATRVRRKKTQTAISQAW